MFKRILFPILAVLLALALCACGQPDAAPAETPAPTAAPSPAEGGPSAEQDAAARRALALQYVDRNAEDLIRELGEPLERSYVPSCLGGGEDGELRYEGFTVYTYREDGLETVRAVS